MIVIVCSFITQPNMYARGILFGKMKYELGDHSFVRCPETGLVADLEFKTKGYFGGTYNAIGGFIKDMKTDKSLYELSGLWNEEMYIKDLTVCIPLYYALRSRILLYQIQYYANTAKYYRLNDTNSHLRLARKYFSSMLLMPKRRLQRRVL